MLSPESMINLLLPTGGALLGTMLGAVLSYRASTRMYRLDKSKFVSSMSKHEELERARITAYRELWQCLGGISTRHPNEIVKNLGSVQERLQQWYYESGGGLFLEGAAEKGESTKASFFVVRDLQSTDPSEIWHAFHSLRRNVRRDIGIFESDADQADALAHVKTKLRNFER
jgi:hypothetical protein